MSWFSRLTNALRSQNLDRDLSEEMSDHLERRSETLHEQGLAPEEARRKALLRFGNLTQLHEQSREARLSTAVETTVQDIRYAWRGLLKTPGFSATAIISLALAIGANTAIYSIVDAAILRPLPVPEPDRLFTLASPTIEAAGSDAHGENESFSYPLYLQFREAAGKSAQLALFSYAGPREVQIPDTNAPIEKAVMQFASGEAFEILRVPPALGQPFTRELDRVPGGHPVAMISHDYWMRRFAGDPHVIGQGLEIEGKHYSVMGVARKGFFGIEPGKFVDVWLPAMMYYNKPAFTTPGWSWFRIVGRLAPGYIPVQLQARLQPAFRLHEEAMITMFPTMPPAIQQQFRQSDLRAHSGAGGASQFRETFARPLWIVLGVAVGILLIACANVASLLLARSSARAGEMAMRISLGAGRLRLVRQLLTESLLLSVLAGALGWELARLAAPALVRLLSTDMSPVRFALAMDTRVLLFCAAVSTAAAVFFGLLPAWQASGARPMRDLRATQFMMSRMGMGRFFVGIQVAFAFCLVVAGSGFLFSLKNLFDVKKGFDPHNVAVFSISTSGLSDMTQKAQLNVFLDDVQHRLEALPGVQGAAIAQWTLFDGSHAGLQVILPGKPLPEREEIIYSVSPRYFSTMRIPLISGRDFEQRDRAYSAGSARPTIINQAFAQRYFGTENPVGKIFQTPDEKALQSHEIVGIVADSSFESVRKGPEPIAYSVVRGTNYFTVYVRSGLNLGTLTRMVENETTTMINGTRVRGVSTLDTIIGDTLLREKLLAGIGGVFAFLALLLAGIGLFGLLNYSVVRRTREIGIRSALGARPLSLVLLVLKEALTLVVGGVVAGLAGSFILLSAVRSMLFGLGPADPLTISTAAVVFLLATLIAGGAPAGRAVVIDPVTALRHE